MQVLNIDYYSFGSLFDRAVHNQGTEIKAITYSNMQIYDRTGTTDCGSSTITEVQSTNEVSRHAVDLFVIVDI